MRDRLAAAAANLRLLAGRPAGPHATHYTLCCPAHLRWRRL